MNKPRVASSHAADLAVSAEELALLKVNSPELGKPTPQSVTSGLHTLDQLIAEIRSDAFSGLENFCKIPPAYTKCLLDFDFRSLPDDDSPEALAAFNPEAGVVINPHTVHLDTINLFKACLSGLPEFCYERDPLRPRFGAYLFGPPGSGKTHLKDQEDRLEVAKALIENRLANNRMATFITSNVSPDELDTGAAVLNQRLRSRCRELYIPLDFSGVPDWRQEIRARKNLQLLSQVQSATAHQVEQLLERAMAAGLGERWGQRDAQKAT